MLDSRKLMVRRSCVDEVFGHLYEEIVSLRLRPGDKISEAEIASKFGVSRQPVRDAFSRLADLDLILVRPQRATEVRGFSPRKIRKSRFIRLSVEKEVTGRACLNCDKEGRRLLDASIAAQRKIVEQSDYDQYHIIDYSFHETVCIVGNVEFAIEIIRDEMANVDRLCNLDLAREAAVPELFEDHIRIAEAIKSGEQAAAISHVIRHLSRLDARIETVKRQNPEYFEPE